MKDGNRSLILHDCANDIHLLGAQITVLLKDTRSYKCLKTGWRWNLYLAHFFSLPPIPHVHVCAPVSVSGYERASNLECQESYIRLCDARSLTGPETCELDSAPGQQVPEICLFRPPQCFLLEGRESDSGPYVCPVGAFSTRPSAQALACDFLGWVVCLFIYRENPRWKSWSQCFWITAVLARGQGKFPDVPWSGWVVRAVVCLLWNLARFILSLYSLT